MEYESVSTLAQLVESSERKTERIELEDGLFVVVKELEGSERFAVAEMEASSQWDYLRFCALHGSVDPKLDEETIDQLRPEYVGTMAKAVMRLSGVDEVSEEDAEKKSGENTDTGFESAESLD